MIDGRGERGRAAGPCRPHLRADILHQLDVRRGLTQRLRDAKRKAPGIDQHHNIGARRERCLHSGGDGALDAAVREQPVDEAEHREAGNVGCTPDAGFRHQGAADATEVKRGIALHQRMGEIGAQRVA
jgi:hypothetical protein